MLQVAAPSLERQVTPRTGIRRGVTLVELMVAMAITGLVATFVAGWIVHSAKQSAASQQRDDREQELSLLRSELFQDGIRGRTLEIGCKSWKIARGGTGGEPDTVEWRIDPFHLVRGSTAKLGRDTLLEGSIEPKATGLDPNWDLWTQVDRNFDGLVDPEHVSQLVRFELRLVVRRHATPARRSTTDTLLIQVPLQGPG